MAVSPSATVRFAAKRPTFTGSFPASASIWLTPWEDLATYTFNTHTAKHHFCPRCGVAPFYIARSDPDKIDVNLRCVEGIELSGLEIHQIDGRNWEQTHEDRAAKPERP